MKFIGQLGVGKIMRDRWFNIRKKVSNLILGAKQPPVFLIPATLASWARTYKLPRGVVEQSHAVVAVLA